MSTQESGIWIELVKAIPNVVTAVTAVVGVVIGVRGLNKWRAETIGKRKAELAEEVLANFYEARDIINAVRSPGGFGGEGTTRHQFEWETGDDTRTLNAYSVTIERLTKRADFFAQLHARRYRFIAHFGNDSAKPYDDFLKIYSEIIVAAHMLIATYQQRKTGSLPENREKWEASIGCGLMDKDPIPARLDNIVASIEAICRPAIQETVK